MSPTIGPKRCTSGVPGLDEILQGGFPCGSFYLIEGDPGVGKTTLSLQFLIEGIRQQEKGLYITLSESKEELIQVAESHGWSLDALAVVDLSAVEAQLLPDAQQTLFHPPEVDLNKTTKLLFDEVERVRPQRVVFDSFSELRLLAQSPLRYRRQILALKRFFASRQCTVLVLDNESANRGDLHIQTIIHGIVALQKTTPGYGDDRYRLRIVKLRGIQYRQGHHDYQIKRGGLVIYPRMIAAERGQVHEDIQFSSGLPALDALLGGGLDAGTSTLVMGPAGTGKTTVVMQYAIQAAERGQRVVIYEFDENRSLLVRRRGNMGARIQQLTSSRLLDIVQINPAEMSPGQMASIIRREVEKESTRMLIIDSINGYLNAMPDEAHLSLQLHELLSYLGDQGLCTILVMAQHGIVGNMEVPANLSYLIDTVVLLRFFEASGEIKRAVSVLKKRSGGHERTIRQFRIEADGLHIGPPLSGFQGVLTGVPTFIGSSDLLEGHDKNNSSV